MVTFDRNVLTWVGRFSQVEPVAMNERKDGDSNRGPAVMIQSTQMAGLRVAIVLSIDNKIGI